MSKIRVTESNQIFVALKTMKNGQTEIFLSESRQDSLDEFNTQYQTETDVSSCVLMKGQELIRLTKIGWGETESET